MTGGSLAFGNVLTGTTSAARTLTLHNTGTAILTGVTLAFSSPSYSRSGGTCGATLAAASYCTISVVYSPVAPASENATLTTTGSVDVTGSPVSLSGTGIPPAPTLASIAPLTDVQGATVPVTLTGTNFVSGATVAVSNTGIGVSNVVLVNPTQITATLTIAGDAALGPANVTVTTSGGTSSAAVFAVNPPAPTLTSVSPATGVQGGSVPVSLSGSNFVSGTILAVSNSGIGVSNVVLVSQTQITATLTVTGSAALGVANVTVTTSGGTTNALPFTVNPPAPPLINSLSPSTGAANTQVTIDGSGFGPQATGTVWLGSSPAGSVVSWSATQIVATVACNSKSGAVRVRQGETWSNAPDFTVTTATVSTVAPDNGVAGVTVVTITGAGFGALQGTGGQVWLGTANGVVQSWSDTQVVATVGMGAASGSARILQGCVMSNAKPFSVDRRHIDSITPNSGLPGTLVTITGTGFGLAQGSGTVMLGSANGVDVIWSDTLITARVAATSLTGTVQVQQHGAVSNAMSFIVPVPGGNILVPNVVNMMVGDPRTLQALNAAGQPATGLTWRSSDPALVSLSTEDPPLLTALAPGHVTITAGTATTDITISAGALPVGTVLWSNPGNGSGVTKIVPAVPSPSGVADVFAFQGDIHNQTVQAITSDGTTAWTANVSMAEAVPDFQGGLIVTDYVSIWKLDGITGQRYAAYTPVGTLGIWGPLAVHTDGTVFAILYNSDDFSYSVIGVDPTTGAQKFSVPLVGRSDSLMIAGDGYAYMVDSSGERVGDQNRTHLMLLRVDSNGAYAETEIKNWTASAPWWQYETCVSANIITNADQGILLTWAATTNCWIPTLQPGGPAKGIQPSGALLAPTPEYGVATVTGSSVSLASGPTVPGQNSNVVPVLQAQDGSFVGTAQVEGDETPYMVAFDATGSVRWSVAGYGPKIATADGGVIAQAYDPSTEDFTGPAVTFDQNGNATEQTNLPTYSWLGNAYQVGSVDQVAAMAPYFALSFWPFEGGNASGNGSAYFRRDSKTNDKVKTILTPTMWQKFAKSNCAAVFANPQSIAGGVANYSLRTVQMKQGLTNFYDIGNPGVGVLTLREVTGGQVSNFRTLAEHLSTANATTVNMCYGSQTAVLLKSEVLSRQYPQFVLVHELLLHAYGNWWDDAIFGNAFLTQKGLWRPAGSTATSTITTWMSTDCTCTPENPATANSCQANTARW